MLSLVTVQLRVMLSLFAVLLVTLSLVAVLMVALSLVAVHAAGRIVTDRDVHGRLTKINWSSMKSMKISV